MKLQTVKRLDGQLTCVLSFFSGSSLNLELTYEINLDIESLSALNHIAVLLLVLTIIKLLFPDPVFWTKL